MRIVRNSRPRAMESLQLQSSDAALHSSPTAQIFSSDPAEFASTPPSSPPPSTTPSAKSLHPQPPQRNAFSVLGKRKALQPIPPNAAPPAKKPTLASEASKPAAPQALTQMQLLCGQAMQKRCKTCGMEFVPSSAEDRKVHEKFHRLATEGYDLGRGFVETMRKEKKKGAVFEGEREGDAVCVVHATDRPAWRRRAGDVLGIVQRELGAVEIREEELWGGCGKGREAEGGRFTAYLYVRGGKCVGFLLAERIRQARRVEEPESLQSMGKIAVVSAGNGSSALSALKARQTAMAEAAKAPLRLATRSQPAMLGISRIWTSPTHRKANIATRLLDVAYECARGNAGDRDETDQQMKRSSASEKGRRHSETTEVSSRLSSKTQVAFSQPTAAGTRLARRWFGRLWGWAVYVE